MIGPGADAKVLVCTQPVDGRKGIDSLVHLVQNGLGQDPYGGVVYIFRSKRKDRLSILWWDGSGLWLMLKRAEAREGSAGRKKHDGSYRLTAAQMSTCCRPRSASRARSTSRNQTKNHHCSAGLSTYALRSV